MIQQVTAIYDGQNLALEKPLRIPINTRLKIAFELPKRKSKGDVFRMIVDESVNTGIKDWSRNHDQHIYDSKRAK
ncbi:MAG TPA: hypothetical protein DET40_22425 [Lentisphaeria bacterium]|nr:MAG: hypothetical protein A2X45_24725 [Lentisphaerae bacterium GWF2_50_93]HCE46311.1 hypothetical protein [Lentisphaeria bacterium]